MGRTNQRIQLKDGRSLGFAEFGDPEGKPVFVCHGFPGSRLDWRLFLDASDSQSANARVIVSDRPGMGMSDFKAGRTLLDWPDDIVELADALKIERFAALGISGGGPYAAACAYKIPDRLTATAIISGMGPADAPGSSKGTAWTFSRKSPLLRRLILKLTSMGVSKKPEKIRSKMLDSLVGPDRLLFAAHPELAHKVVESWAEAFRPGIAGVDHEAAIYKRLWQFQLADVSARIYLWHGEQDENVPVSVGRHVASSLPNCEVKFFENEGHFSLLYNHIDECLRLLVA
jgi:pimeloyl-ACP methyl ester carboxylesterase